MSPSCLISRLGRISLLAISLAEETLATSTRGLSIVQMTMKDSVLHITKSISVSIDTARFCKSDTVRFCKSLFVSEIGDGRSLCSSEADLI